MGTEKGVIILVVFFSAASGALGPEQYCHSSRGLILTLENAFIQHQ